VKKEGRVARKGEFRHTEWAEAHKGDHQKVVYKRKSDNECTRGGMKNHAWKYSRKPVQVSAVNRGRAKRKQRWAFAPLGCPHVAPMAANGQGVLGGSIGVRYSDSWELDRNYIGELVKKTLVRQARYNCWLRYRSSKYW